MAVWEPARGGFEVDAVARIESTASPGEILVSQTVRDLTARSGLVYEDAGDNIAVAALYATVPVPDEMIS